MMCSMFSIFDPSCMIMNSSVSSKWVIALCLFILYNWQFFYLPSGPYILLNQASNIFINMTKISFFRNYKKTVLILISLFFFIFFSGEFGMIPYIFTCTSHLCVNLSLSLSLWLGGVMLAFFISWNKAISHFVPLGCPNILVPFLVIIETLSNFIRPLSLCLRLMSNMMAGHIIIILVSESISYLFSSPLFIILSFIQMFLLLFEIGVAFIQAYVFTNLISMYWQENMH